MVSVWVVWTRVVAPCSKPKLDPNHKMAAREGKWNRNSHLKFIQLSEFCLRPPPPPSSNVGVDFRRWIALAPTLENGGQGGYVYAKGNICDATIQFAFYRKDDQIDLHVPYFGVKVVTSKLKVAISFSFAGQLWKSLCMLCMHARMNTCMHVEMYLCT